MGQKVKIGPYAVFRTKKEFDDCVAKLMSEYIVDYMKPHRQDAYNKGLDAGTVYGLDMTLLALGRMINGIGVEHRCENCLCYGKSCIPKEGADLCENHEEHADWCSKGIDISDQNFLIEFMKTVGEAAADYGELFDIDLEENNDKDFWWSGSKLDQELFSYIPREIYPSFEERYKKK